MPARRLRLVLALAVLVAGFTPVSASAQELPDLTLEDIIARGVFQPAGFEGGRWAEEGPVITYVERTGRGDSTTHLVQFNLESDSRGRLVDGTELQAPDVDRQIVIEDYEFGSDREKVLIFTDSREVWRYNTEGFYYVYDRTDGSLVPISDREEGHQMFAKFGPDARRVAFVRNRDLFVVDLETGEERRLTDSGSEGGVINGTSDWVYEEEFGLRDGWSWSPDGRHIAFFQLDESATRTYTLQDLREGQYPEHTRYRYPKAGRENSEIRAGVVEVGSGTTRFFDSGTWYAGGDSLEYIPRMGWTPPIDGRSRVWMFRMNRNQNHLDLLYADPADGQVRQVFEEDSETWIEVRTGFTGLDVGKITYLEDDRHFVWVSEVDGHRHLYLHRNDGARVGRITDGPWDVTDFHGVDEEEGAVYFTATRAGSVERQLYRTPLRLGANSAGENEPSSGTAGAVERITERRGWHGIDLSPDARYYIDTHSDADSPPVVSLHTVSGDRITTLQENEELRDTLDRYRLPYPEFTTVPGADGTSLNAYVIKPRDFDPEKKYPLLMYVYGGPGAQTVQRSWGGSRYLWHVYLAREHDVVVASVDNRGTGGRGKAFKSLTYRRLGQIETRDQQAAARALRERSYVDTSRVAIWGWSYGGYMTLMSMLSGDGPRLFDVGLAVAPVTHWKLYDTIYTERYMRTPEANPDGYRKGSPITYADRLRGDQDLLMVHGDLDDNVHLQNTVQMITALQDANRQFDFMLYPGRDHGITGGTIRLHLFRKLTNFLVGNLE